MTTLGVLLFSSFIGWVIFLGIPEKNIDGLRLTGFFLTTLLFILSLGVWYEYDARIIVGFQQYIIFSEMFQFGIDGISLIFILLTTSIYPIVMLAGWTTSLYTKELYSFLLFSEFLLLMVFSILDLFGFYIFFELLLFPMIFLIGMWGSRARRIKASYYFFFYTMAGSLLMLFGLIFLYFELGSTNFLILFLNDFNYRKQKILWFLFFFTFAIKIPMFPFHIWLPEAHVEASTIGSVLLAALLLKLGTYGFLRVLISMFPNAMYFFSPFVIVLSLLSILFSSLILLRQIDIKRIIAYSSVAHMNFGILGLFSQVLEGVEGGIYLMFSHGYSSGALFLCAGMLYDRYHTRLLHYYSGFSLIMPLYTICFFLIILANFGFPGTANFIGEFLIIIGLIQFNNSGVILGFIIGLILSVVYSILLYNRICFGELKMERFIHLYYADLSRREFFLLLPLIFFIFLFGLGSAYVFDLFHGSAIQLMIFCK